jgi:hypothetical protein
MATVKNERYIPLKNYLIAFGIVIAIILITWWACAWYNVHKDKKLSASYLISQKVISQEIDELSEIDDILSEPYSTYFIYVSYTGSEEIYNMEKEIKDIIVDYKLSDKLYYLNVTSIKNDKDVIEKINDALHLEGKDIEKIPTILYIKDGVVIDVITRQDNRIMEKGDFEKLLEVNNIQK